MKKTPQKLRKLNPMKDGTHTRWENQGFKTVSIYEIPFKLDLANPDVFSNLVYGNSADNNGIKYVADVKQGHGFKGGRGRKYIILENPLVAHHANQSEVVDAYAWLRLTNSVDNSVIATGNAYERFNSDIVSTIDNMTNNHRSRSKRIANQKSRINSGRIYGEEGMTHDMNEISRLMRTWAGKTPGEWTKIDQLDPEKVRAIALKMIDPQPIPRHHVRSGKDSLPHFAVNQKAVKNLFKWLHEFNYMDVMLEDIRLHSEIYSNIKNNLNPVDLQRANRSLDIYEDNYFDKLQTEFKEAGSVMVTAMSDKMGVTGTFAAELLKQKNIVKLSTGEEIDLLHDNGVLSNGQAHKVKFYKPGDMSKRLNRCR